MRKLIVALLLTQAVNTAAGPNANARLFIDFNGGIASIDSVTTCPAESTITAAVVMVGATRLFSSESYVRYDTADLRYISAQKGNASLTNFLESAGGSVMFTAGKSLRDSCLVRVSCLILGNNPSNCTSGDGVLGLITFKKRNSDTTRLSIEQAQCEDCDLTADNTMRCNGGGLIPGQFTSIAWSPLKRTTTVMSTMSRGRLSIRLPKMVDYAMTIADPLGRTILVRNGYSDKVIIDARNLGRPAAGSGVVLVRIRYLGEERAFPMVLQRFE